jgi:EmrB/QacA subfamily drug resistance transporter
MKTHQTENTTHKWRAFIGIALLSFGCYLDYTIVNVALPTIQRELQANLTQLQWVMNIYFLALCILATILGRCGDLYGRRRVFYLGVGIFAIASLVAGLASTIHWLIFGRLLQGIGAAIVFPLGLSLLPESFPEHERQKAIAWLGSLGGIALALGPVLGGVIVEYCGWRWIFFINIPIIILGYLFACKAVKESLVKSIDRSLDWIGMLLLSLGLGGIVMSLMHSESAGWTDLSTLAYLVVGIVSSFLLVKVERQKENPLIDFKDFAHPLFYAGAVLCLLAGALSAIALFFDPLYLQIIRAQSPAFSGLVLFAIPVAVFFVAFFVGPLVSRLGILKTISLGLLLGAFAGFLQLFFSAMSPLWYVLVAFVCLGSMWAMGNTVPIMAAQAVVGAERSSVATGTMVTLFNIGGSIGLSIAVVIYNFVGMKGLNTVQVTHAQLQRNDLAQLTELIGNPAKALEISMNTSMHQFFNDAFMHGFTGVMCFLFLLSVLMFLSVLLLCYKKGR